MQQVVPHNWHGRSSYFFAFLFLFACGSESPEKAILNSEFVEANTKWKLEREKELKSEDGYLTLAGFHWLQQGDYILGDHEAADIRFPKMSTNGLVGKLIVKNDSLATFYGRNEQNGIRLSLSDDPVKEISFERTRFYLIKRNGKMALRIEWLDAPTRLNFSSIDYFDLDQSLAIPARFELYEKERKVRIGNIRDYVSDEVSHGELVFNLFGQEQRLQSMSDPEEGKYFVIFGDETNSRTSYGGGRFIWVDGPDENGNTTIDFNRAYNPPCAFTKFSTCPIPPEQNRLRGSIEGGERIYKRTTS